MAASRLCGWGYSLSAGNAKPTTRWRLIVSVALLFTMSSASSLSSQEKSTEKTPLDNKYFVEGTVTLPNGSPADKATIYLRQSDGETILLPTNPQVAIADSKGRYVFNDLESGTYQVWAEQAEFTSLKEKLRGMKVVVEKGSIR